VHLTCCTSFDILHDMVMHAWTPVILGDVLCHFGNSGVSCSDMVVKKGNHPPLKIIVSHNNKRGAFPPKIARLVVDVMHVMPANQWNLILLEALCMQNLSFNVCVDIFIVNVLNLYRGLNIHVWDISAFLAGGIFKEDGPYMGWFCELCL
jgi:hypothetical protein